MCNKIKPDAQKLAEALTIFFDQLEQEDKRKSFTEKFEEKKKQKTVKETHKRQTYLIDNNLIHRLNRLANEQPKGFKTAVVNEGIRQMLDEIEEEMENMSNE